METGLAAFAQALRRRAELQTVALDDIANRLQALLALAAIARHIVALTPRIGPLLWQAAQREARNAAPGDEQERSDALTRHWQAWREP